MSRTGIESTEAPLAELLGGGAQWCFGAVAQLSHNCCSACGYSSAMVQHECRTRNCAVEERDGTLAPWLGFRIPTCKQLKCFCGIFASPGDTLLLHCVRVSHWLLESTVYTACNVCRGIRTVFILTFSHKLLRVGFSKSRTWL